jgi:proline-specific peptidase
MTEGFAPFKVGGETFQTYYKIFGTLEGRTRPPLMVLHGGAGLTHDYMLSHADIAKSGVPVVLYDQLGNGRATHLPDKPTEFWTIDLFIDELLSLLAHLNIEEYSIAGHSWGGMLGAALVLRRHPAGLKHLVLGNSLPSMKLWDEAEGRLMTAFPDWVKEGLGKPQADPAFRRALDAVHAVHAVRVQPFPPEFVRSIDASYGPTADRTVLEAMCVRDVPATDVMLTALACAGCGRVR